MTDRELLLFAAKAAGIKRDISDEVWHSSESYVRPDWNPLTDDGDAFRLAVKLRMHLTATPNGYIRAESQDRKVMREEKLDWDLGDVGATRRAIVETAAEIGRKS